jgi:hypothetical protein
MELWAKGIRLRARAEGYILNFAKGGTTHTEYVTDDLLDALTVGLKMAAHPPVRLRRFSRAFIREHNAELKKRQVKERQGRSGG